MCGIFAVLQKISSFNKSISKSIISKEFMKGQSRGPENSVLKEINNNLILGFHRLAINGLDDISNQPICIDGIYLICNGEIYNYKHILKNLNITPQTNSDCECIIHLYKKYGIQYTLENLDGVFSFLIYDSNIQQIYAARDPFGVRPMYIGTNNEDIVVISSLLKQTEGFNIRTTDFPSGSYINIHISSMNILHISDYKKYTNFNYNMGLIPITNIDYCYSTIYNLLIESVKKRVINSERNLACLLSGGLDSSLISAIVAKWVPKGQLQTFSIGMMGGSDLKYAKMVSEHINSNHTEIILSEQEFFDAIPEVIYNIESYDTTTVRASVGNYLVAKYISEHSDAKVIFNGDGSDELTGGYMYFHNCPNNMEFDYECKRLLNDIQYFDVLRSDRTISCHGLEARTPFLDRTFVNNYLSLPIEFRNHNNNKNSNNKIEKWLLRQSIQENDPELLPNNVLWRSKEAFSDGVSSHNKSWYEIIQDRLNSQYSENDFKSKCEKYNHNKPTTVDQLYYREIFDSHFHNKDKIIPYFWMPKYSNVTDSSARKLDIYKEKNKMSKTNLTIDVNC